MGIDDPYTAFCLDEAITLIMNHLENKEKPTFRSPEKHFSSFKDFYSQFK